MIYLIRRRSYFSGRGALSGLQAAMRDIMSIRKKWPGNLFVIFTAVLFVVSAGGCGGQPALAKKTASNTSKELAVGDIWIVDETTRLGTLTISEGAVVRAPDGYSLTLTVNGVETGQKLATTAGVDTQITAGTYRGNVVLTVTETNAVPYQGLNFPLRQGLYLDETGIVKTKSVLAAVAGNIDTIPYLSNIQIRSTGECFNGIIKALPWPPKRSHKRSKISMMLRGQHPSVH